jgi:prepilin-type N-terminal cleavage/methylation domain-containing protein
MNLFQKHRKTQKSPQLNHGFTLIELLLYIAVASIILLVSTLFLFSLLESRVKNQTIAEVEQQGLQVMQVITQTIRNAEAVNSPAQGTSASTLSLDVVNATFDPTVFNLSSEVMNIKEGTNAAISLTNSRVIASGLSFQNLSRANTPGTVRVQYTLTHRNPDGRNEYSFAKTFVGSATLRQP